MQETMLICDRTNDPPTRSSEPDPRSYLWVTVFQSKIQAYAINNSMTDIEELGESQPLLKQKEV